MVEPQAESSRTSAMLLCLSLVSAVVVFCVPCSIADPDILWHLRDAQWQLQHHAFLREDVFSFTARGSAWMNHEWLAELPFYVAFTAWKSAGLYAVTLAAAEAIFAGVFILAWQASSSAPAACVATCVGALLATVSFGPRTLLFGWLLLVLELLVLARAQRHPRLVWALPLLFAVWVNTHGSWLIGLAVLALFVVSQWLQMSAGSIENCRADRSQRMRLLRTSALSVAALFVNPYGWRLVGYPFDLAFRQRLNVGNVEEWQSVDFHSPRGRILCACLLLLFIAQLVRARRWTVFELALTGIGTYSALVYSRFLFLAAIMVMPVVAKSLAHSMPRHWMTKRGLRLSPRVASALLFVIACLVAGRLRGERVVGIDEDPRFPGRALPFLATFHPQGRVFNDFKWGGFLVWHMRDTPIFIDSRVDIFERNGSFADYLDIVRLRDSLALLDKHRVRYVFFERDAPLAYLLLQSHAWKVEYEDATCVLLRRSEP